MRAIPMKMVRSLLVAMSMLAPAAISGAQVACTPNPALAAGPGTIAGMITDTQGTIIDNVDVYLGAPRRRVLATNGHFRFDSLAAGDYQVSTRRLGYQPQVRTVSVAQTGAVVAFCLVPAPRNLPPVITTRATGGLAGVITDSASHGLADVEIVVSGPNGTQTTVSDGSGDFYVDVRSGPYMVRVTRPWFATGTVSVTIPRDSGRYVRIPLTATRTKPSSVEDVNAFEWHQTMIRAVGLKVYTRDDIAKSGMTEALQIARSWAGVMDESCPVLIQNDGQEYMVPLWSLAAEDVEMLAVVRGSMRPTSVSNGGRGAPRASMSVRSGACSATVYGWLKK